MIVISQLRILKIPHRVTTKTNINQNKFNLVIKNNQQFFSSQINSYLHYTNFLGITTQLRWIQKSLHFGFSLFFFQNPLLNELIYKNNQALLTFFSANNNYRSTKKIFTPSYHSRPHVKRKISIIAQLHRRHLQAKTVSLPTVPQYKSHKFNLNIWSLWKNKTKSTYRLLGIVNHPHPTPHELTNYTKRKELVFKFLNKPSLIDKKSKIRLVVKLQKFFHKISSYPLLNATLLHLTNPQKKSIIFTKTIKQTKPHFFLALKTLPQTSPNLGKSFPKLFFNNWTHQPLSLMHGTQKLMTNYQMPPLKLASLTSANLQYKTNNFMTFGGKTKIQPNLHMFMAEPMFTTNSTKTIIDYSYWQSIIQTWLVQKTSTYFHKKKKIFWKTFFRTLFTPRNLTNSFFTKYRIYSSSTFSHLPHLSLGIQLSSTPRLLNSLPLTYFKKIHLINYLHNYLQKSQHTTHKLKIQFPNRSNEQIPNYDLIKLYTNTSNWPKNFFLKTTAPKPQPHPASNPYNLMNKYTTITYTKKKIRFRKWKTCFLKKHKLLKLKGLLTPALLFFKENIMRLCTTLRSFKFKTLSMRKQFTIFDNYALQLTTTSTHNLVLSCTPRQPLLVQYFYFTPVKTSKFHRTTYFFNQFLSLLKFIPNSISANKTKFYYIEPYDFINFTQVKKNMFQRLLQQKYKYDLTKITIKTSFLSYPLYQSPLYLPTHSDTSSHLLTSPQPTFFSKDKLSLYYSQLYPLYLKLYQKSSKTAVFIRKTRFKPGYNTLWRRERQVIKQVFSLSHRYQYRLTPKLHKLYLAFRTHKHNTYVVDLVTILIITSFTPDKYSSQALIRNKYVYLNGLMAWNEKLQIFINDFIQLIINIRFYILWKWLKTQSKFTFIKWSKKFYKTYRIKRQLFREFKVRTLPNQILNIQHSWWDIPKFCEVDYFTLSIFVIQHISYFLINNPYFFTSLRSSILNIYNWKYLT